MIINNDSGFEPVVGSLASSPDIKKNKWVLMILALVDNTENKNALVGR